ncbi:MAG: PAS domain S-box protein [Nitrospirae bacterium]|nr:PAS domain S-box protein [Nitrospirota bacterium]
MILLNAFTIYSNTVRNIIDALLLISMVSPIIYYYLVRPFKASHELLQTLMDNIPDSIYFKDEKSRFVIVNRAKAERSQTTPENMIGKTDFDFLPEDQARESFMDDERIVATGSFVKDKVEELTRKDGSMTWVSVAKVPWRNDKGMIIGTVGISRDITRRKLAEREFNRFFQFSLDLFCIAGFDGYLRQVNPMFESIFGFSTEEILSKPFIEMFHPDDHESVIALMEKSANGISTTYFESRCLCKDASFKHIAWSAFPVVDEGVLYAVARDMTSQKWMEEQYKSIIYASMDGFWQIDTHGNILDVNESQCNLLGYTKDELLKMNLSGIVIAKEPGQVEENIKNIMMEGYGRFERKYKCKDGRVIDVEVSVNYLKTGNSEKLFAFSRDITDRKKAEKDVEEKAKELQRLNLTLEQRVTEEIEKRRIKEQLLIQQSKLATMGEMIVAIAHQWRQPLSAVSALVQDIQDANEYGELDNKYLNETVYNTMQQIDFMSKTIDDFRTFFKPSADKVPFNLKKAFNDIESIIYAQLKNNTINYKISCRFSDKICNVNDDGHLCENMIVHGYPNEFKHVIINIIRNAMDAIVARREKGELGKEDGEIITDVSKESDKYIIKIKDNGGGIPLEIIDKIFEPYFTTKSEMKGTGIGLYMAKVIIENNMDGKIVCDNIENGAMFTIEIKNNSGNIPDSVTSTVI